MADLRLEIIGLSNYADFSKDGKFNITGLFDEVYVQSTPSTLLRGFVVFILVGLPKQSVNLEVRITDPDNQEILKAPVKLVTGGNGKGNFFAELVNLPLRIEGDYKISIIKGQKTLGYTNFKVIVVGPHEAKKDESTTN